MRKKSKELLDNLNKITQKPNRFERKPTISHTNKMYKSVIDTYEFPKSYKGPFYLKHPSKNKYSKETGKFVKETKTKSELLEELNQKHNISTQKYLSLEDVQTLCKQNKVNLIRTRKEKIPGWCGSPKGLLQVLFERGIINQRHASRKLSSLSNKIKK